MIFDSKPLDAIEENDLQALLVNLVPERKRIEYKLDAPTDKLKDRKEFLADVSSFANTAGGYLLYGVKAKDGIPTEICGIERDRVDALKLKWENMLRDAISPRIPQLDIREVELCTGNWVIILRIPRSFLAPHRVTLENHGHFYGRNSAGHFQMDVPQLRTAFELSGTLAERIRNFRADRLSKIAAGEVPVPLDETMAKIVLHLVPFGAFEPSARYDLSPLTLPNNRILIKPLILWINEIQILNYCRNRYNFDGLVNYIKQGNEAPITSYLQVFRNGIIEGVDVSILNANSTKKIPSTDFEQVLCHALSLYLQTQKTLGVDLPIFAMVSFLGVKDYMMGYISQTYHGFHDYPIDRSELVIPEVIIDRFDCDPSEVMKPIFDTVWNAAGWKGSINYDAEGKWKLQKL